MPAVTDADMRDTRRADDGKARKVSAGAAFDATAWLAAIVEDTDDAIVSKTLDSIILTWNTGAERLFGYTANEAVGQPVTILIPEDRLTEEDQILSRLRAGERVDHFETIRRHKNGSLLDVSLTVSPVRNADGEIIGASKIARDISELQQSRAAQAIVVREMSHRIKNIFGLISGLITMSARAAQNDGELAPALLARLEALARAHELTLPDLQLDHASEKSISFVQLLKTIVAPHQLGSDRLVVQGDDVTLAGTALPSIALLLHELTTNAAKYGALSTEEGRIEVATRMVDDQFQLDWVERGGPPVKAAPSGKGFGSVLEAAAIRGLRGNLLRHWDEAGLRLALSFPVARLAV